MVGRQLINILGTVNNAASFPGTNNSGIKAGLVLASTGDTTAAAWIYITSLPTSVSRTILKNGETGMGNGGWNFMLTTAGKLNLNDPGGAWGGTGTTTIPLNTWTHVAFIRSGNNTQMYINGFAEGSIITGGFNNPQTYTAIGCTYNTSTISYTNVFNGIIDDPYIWGRAIDPIVELGYLVSPDGLHFPSSNSLRAHWTLDESTGASVVADSSGNGFTGTIIGTVTFVPGIIQTFGIPPRTALPMARTIAGIRTKVTY